MDRILVGAEAAAYLKSHVTQHVQETGKGIRVTIDRSPNVQKLELEAIVKLVDSLIAERVSFEGYDISDFTANLYSSRGHLVRAIKEVA